jgi:hypothetical protein
MDPSREGHYPTVIEGLVRDGQLHITIHNLLSGEVQQTLTFDRCRKK